MAGTRTIHRGSGGKFAGASGGRAERVRVGSGYKQSGAARTSSSQAQRSSRLTRAVGRTASTARRTATRVAKSRTVRRAALAGAVAAVGVRTTGPAAKIIREVARG